MDIGHLVNFHSTANKFVKHEEKKFAFEIKQTGHIEFNTKTPSIDSSPLPNPISITDKLIANIENSLNFSLAFDCKL